MFNLFSGFNNDGAFYLNADENNNSFAVVTYVLTGVIALLYLYIIFGIVVRKTVRSKSKIKFFNKPLNAILYTLMVLLVVFNSLCYVFLLVGGKVIPEGNDQAQIGSIVVWIFFIVEVICAIAILVFAYLTIYKLQIIFEPTKIIFFGEELMIKKIVRIVEDESSQILGIIYQEGKSKTRKLKYSLGSVAGQFLLKNFKDLKFEIKKENFVEAFKKVEYETTSQRKTKSVVDSDSKVSTTSLKNDAKAPTPDKSASGKTIDLKNIDSLANIVDQKESTPKTSTNAKKPRTTTSSSSKPKPKPKSQSSSKMPIKDDSEKE